MGYRIHCRARLRHLALPCRVISLTEIQSAVLTVERHDSFQIRDMSKESLEYINS
jgi:hypothetical protein